MPRVTETGLSGFAPQGDRGRRTLGVMVEGSFRSYFAGRTSPLLEQRDAEPEPESEQSEPMQAATLDEQADDSPTSAEDELGVVSSVIERSPGSARLFVFGSNGFLSDQVLRVLGSAEGTLYGNSVQLMANVVDWSLEDRSLLDIRARGHFNRTLPPLDSAEQAGLEMLNYAAALGGVGMVFLWHRRRVKRDEQRYRAWLAEGPA
jgi:ABC-2 type transport system permease protein